MESKKIYPEDVVLEPVKLDCLKAPNGKIYAHYFKDRAIYDNITHTKCKTCGINDSEYKGGDCFSCRSKKARERYMALPTTSEFPICDDDNHFFWDEGDLEEYLEDNDLEMEDMYLYAAERKPFIPLDYEYWSDQSTEDGELPSKMEALIDDFNKKLKDIPGLYFQNEKLRYRP
ncbi:hypothetical protein [Niabella aurantiaca]|uniref:hypothetical protein n=1 Tax=Niabella aurantiaca TaxID=379900 RepID=UPI0003656986|nr:hypothetical protein [Niabella aurantiaca]